MGDITPTAPHSLSRGSSFQRMLELEKRCKLERLQSDQDQFDLSPSFQPEPLSPRAPLQLRRANSLSQQQQDLMLKAVRRSIAPPPLSITIPLPRSSQKIGEAKQREVVYEREPEPEPGDLENVEPLQKSVKFLAPDSDEDEESDQSSICHSPSWEGYGQKKKDKKKEAERKRKAKEQKEQAEREAKAAKKRSSSRLNKPVPGLVQQMPTVMERSNSAPLLDSHNSRHLNTNRRLPTVDDEQEYVRLLSRQDLLLRSPNTYDATDMLSPAGNRFIGGLKLQQEREAALQNSIQAQYPFINGSDHRQRVYKSYSTGPAMEMSPPASMASSERNDSRSSRESCPPSASRTPMLRHTSAQQLAMTASRGRDAKAHPVASGHLNDNHFQESLEADAPAFNDRGRSDGYVRYQRDQSTERVLAGLLHEQLASPHPSSSTRSSSQHTRRSSISRDVKTSMSKLTTKRADHIDSESADQGDYFNFLDQPQSPSAVQALQISGDVPAATRSKSTQAGSTSSKATQESTSSAASSSHSGPSKTRSLKDVARAALHMSPSQTQTPTFKPTVKPPPYYLLRAKFSSSSSVPTVGTSISPIQTAQSSQTTQSTQPPKSAPSNSGTGSAPVPNQPGSRVSEGSSSSSNYDDGSPLPSPVTTPDTSRPQSSKGLPLELGTVPQGQAQEFVVQDDARTLRQSSEAVRLAGSADITPRLPKYDDEGNEMAPEDRWSRTAMPLVIDFDDAQSTVSDYSDAREEPAKVSSAPTPLDAESGEREGGSRFDRPGPSFGRPRLPRSSSDPDLSRRTARANSTEPLEQKPVIPRRSRAREQQELVQRPKTASASERPEKEVEEEKPTEEVQEPEQKKKKLRKQKAAGKTVGEEAEVVERATDKSRSRAAPASVSTSLMSARFMSPIGGFIPSYGFASNPLFVDFSEISKAASASDHTTLPVKITATQITFQAQAPASKLITDSNQASAKADVPAPEQAQAQAPEPPKAIARTPSAPTPAAEPRPTPLSRSTTTPVSILKPTPPQPISNQGAGQRPGSPPVLSAIPKHLQPQIAARSTAIAAPELRMAPIAKMFVECCSCKFYHDMPSKLYECMAKPDAVVEDKVRGISGAITTMVKCPWCQHNMSTSCCAGYAAVVYVKEKLH